MQARFRRELTRGEPELARASHRKDAWQHPVRPGDLLRVAVTIIETRRSAKEQTLGVVRWHWKAFNQDDVVVLDLVATNLFKPVF